MFNLVCQNQNQKITMKSKDQTQSPVECERLQQDNADPQMFMFNPHLR